MQECVFANWNTGVSTSTETLKCGAGNKMVNCNGLDGGVGRRVVEHNKRTTPPRKYNHTIRNQRANV
jgi:hypothetical protein